VSDYPKTIFNYPINILCFNRPIYLKQLLISLKTQTVSIPQNLFYFWVDGFFESKDESLGRFNACTEVIELIKDFFPNSILNISNYNLGIAKNYWRAELNSFEKLNMESAFFLEEDLVLSPHYFEVTMKMDTLFAQDKDVSHLSPTGDCAHTLSAPEEYFQPFGHSWGYLLRGWHHFERRTLLEEYINMLKVPYHRRNELQAQILEYFYDLGILIAGTSQDAVKDGLRNYFQRVAITTKEPWASNIGIVGEHFTAATAHHNRPVTKNLDLVPEKLKSEYKSRILLDGQRKTSSQIYKNYLSILLDGQRKTSN
jgi:hypothetical protein